MIRVGFPIVVIYMSMMQMEIAYRMYTISLMVLIGDYFRKKFLPTIVQII